MTAAKQDGPFDVPKKERLKLAELKRLVEEARARGEDTAPLLKRLARQVIDEVKDGLEAKN